MTGVRVDDLLTADGRLSAAALRSSDRVARATGARLVALFPTVEHLIDERQNLLLDCIRRLRAVAHLPLEVIVTYQGGPRESLRRLADDGVRILYADTVRLQRDSEVVLAGAARGKSENLLKALSWLLEQDGDPARTFVFTVDDDYTMNHPINQWLLPVTWLLAQDRQDNVLRLPQDREYLHVKSGSPRLLLPRGLSDEIVAGRPPMSLSHLLEWLLLAGGGISIPRIDPDVIVTPANMARLLGAGTADELRRHADRLLGEGGRTVRFLRELFYYRRERPLYDRLAAFQFPLHGDQGTTLSAWSGMALASSYGLEMSWLVQALVPDADAPARAGVLDVRGVPHAHLPKDFVSSHEMAAEVMFVLDVLEQAYGLGDDPAAFRARYATTPEKRDGGVLSPQHSVRPDPASRVRFYPPARSLSVVREVPGVRLGGGSAGRPGDILAPGRV